MLTQLHVKNLALIDETEVNFGPGLNILTGETGAGKSILIGSIGAALGQKMNKEMIREGEDSALVELIFQIENEKLAMKLQEMGIDLEDGQLIISRKMQNGRTINRVCGETKTASMIKKISSLVLDIHGQHEHQSLLYADRQLEILDEYGRDHLQGMKDNVRESYKEYRDAEKELSGYQLNEQEREREIAFLNFEINEIDEAGLTAGEDEELEKDYRRMSNGKKIAAALQQVYELTSEQAGEAVGRAVRELSAVTQYDEALTSAENILGDTENLLNDFNREIAGYISSFTFSEEEFYRTEQRLDLINKLKDKYGRTISDILAYRDRQARRLEEMENFAERKAALEKKLAGAEKKLEEQSEALSAERRRYAEELSVQIGQGLQDLNFLSADFEIHFEKAVNYSANGFDEIEFRISTNPGEPLRPLNKVVSGGELSRIMLAIKTLLADKDDTETLIFDEIDAGISGRTAQMVSEKMSRIGRHHQVICITHLPQIAAMADEHFLIEKSVRSGATISEIRELREDESVEELARILGGAEITPAVIENAGEMKRLAAEKKMKLEG